MNALACDLFLKLFLSVFFLNLQYIRWKKTGKADKHQAACIPFAHLRCPCAPCAPCATRQAVYGERGRPRQWQFILLCVLWVSAPPRHAGEKRLYGSAWVQEGLATVVGIGEAQPLFVLEEQAQQQQRQQQHWPSHCTSVPPGFRLGMIDS